MNTYYYIQKEQKRTITIKSDGNLLKYFIQLPKTLFIIPTQTSTYSEKTYYFLSTAWQPAEEFNTLLIKNISKKPEHTDTISIIPPLGNSNLNYTCLGEKLKEFYQNTGFDSIKNLTNNLINTYWNSLFDDTYLYFNFISTKHQLLNQWQHNTKHNIKYNIFDEIYDKLPQNTKIQKFLSIPNKKIIE